MAIEFNVDSQVRPYATLSAFPITGSVKTLYIDESTSDLYYWDGSAYAIVKSQSKYEAIDAINGTGATVLKMSVCYLKTSSSSANTPELLLSNASSEATSSKTIGLLLQDLANGATGKIITSGEYDKFDTSAYNVGDRLWLSTTDGQVTTTIPSAPTHAVFIGFVTRKQSQNGRILVSIQNGYELREIHDVSIPTTPSNNEVLSYESVSSLWKPKSITTLLGFTPVPTTRALTINGTTQDLSADRTFTISTGITIGTTAITSGTVGRVLFEGTGNVVSESANLFWDNTNGRLGIGTSSPSQKLDVVGIIKATTSAVGTMLDISGVTNSALNVINDSSGRTFLTVKGNPSATSIGGAFITGEGFQEAWCNVIARQASAGNQYWRFGNSGSSNYFAIQKLNDSASAITLTALTAFSSTGNVGINTTTDAGYKLDVNGTARVSDTLTLGSSTTALSMFSAALTFTQSGGARYINFVNGGITFNNTYAFTIANGSNIPLTATGTDVYIGSQTNNGLFLQRNSSYVYTLNKLNGGNDVSNTFDIRTGDYTSSAFSASSGNIRLYSGDNTGTGGGGFGNLILQHNGTVKRGNILIGTSTNVASAIVNVESTTQGVLFPRMTTTQKNAIASPAAGLMVYDTTLNLMALYNGTVWTTL